MIVLFGFPSAVSYAQRTLWIFKIHKEPLRVYILTVSFTAMASNMRNSKKKKAILIPNSESRSFDL